MTLLPSSKRNDTFVGLWPSFVPKKNDTTKK